MRFLSVSPNHVAAVGGSALVDLLAREPMTALEFNWNSALSSSATFELSPTAVFSVNSCRALGGEENEAFTKSGHRRGMHVACVVESTTVGVFRRDTSSIVWVAKLPSKNKDVSIEHLVLLNAHTVVALGSNKVVYLGQLLGDATDKKTLKIVTMESTIQAAQGICGIVNDSFAPLVQQFAVVVGASIRLIGVRCNKRGLDDAQPVVIQIKKSVKGVSMFSDNAMLIAAPEGCATISVVSLADSRSQVVELKATKGVGDVMFGPHGIVGVINVTGDAVEFVTFVQSEPSEAHPFDVTVLSAVAMPLGKVLAGHTLEKTGEHFVVARDCVTNTLETARLSYKNGAPSQAVIDGVYWAPLAEKSSRAVSSSADGADISSTTTAGASFTYTIWSDESASPVGYCRVTAPSLHHLKLSKQWPSIQRSTHHALESFANSSSELLLVAALNPGAVRNALKKLPLAMFVGIFEKIIRNLTSETLLTGPDAFGAIAVNATDLATQIVTLHRQLGVTLPQKEVLTYFAFLRGIRAAGHGVVKLSHRMGAMLSYHEKELTKCTTKRNARHIDAAWRKGTAPARFSSAATWSDNVSKALSAVDGVTIIKQAASLLESVEPKLSLRQMRSVNHADDVLQRYEATLQL